MVWEKDRPPEARFSRDSSGGTVGESGLSSGSFKNSDHTVFQDMNVSRDDDRLKYWGRKRQKNREGWRGPSQEEPLILDEETKEWKRKIQESELLRPAAAFIGFYVDNNSKKMNKRSFKFHVVIHQIL